MATSYQYIECVGTSTESVEAAIKTAIDTVSQQHKISWFEVTATRGRLIDGKDVEYQVTVKCGVLAA